MLCDSRVGAAGEDPGSGGLGSLQQPLMKAPVEVDPEFMSNSFYERLRELLK